MQRLAGRFLHGVPAQWSKIREVCDCAVNIQYMESAGRCAGQVAFAPGDVRCPKAKLSFVVAQTLVATT